MNDAPGGDEATRAFAHELYVASGAMPGLELRHWLTAELSKRFGPEGSRNEPHDGTPSDAGASFVILVRHAKRCRSAHVPERDQRMDGWPLEERPAERPADDPRKSPWQKTYSIAVAVAEQLATEGVRVTHVLHSPHEVARQTAMVYAGVLCRGGGIVVAAGKWLDPAVFRELESGKVHSQIHALTGLRDPDPPVKAGELEACGKAGTSARAIVLVGHQPQLTDIAHAILNPGWVRRRLWPRGPTSLPLDASEAACLRLGTGGRLRWLATEKEASLSGELKEKIKSKLDVAKFFLGALVINASVLFGGKVWDGDIPGFLLAPGVLSLFVALLLTIATLLAYDKLNMPPQFWGERARDDDPAQPLHARDPSPWRVLRPPSDATVVLFFEMTHVWNVFFLPALVSSVAGIGCLLLGLAAPKLAGLHVLPPRGPLAVLSDAGRTWALALLAMVVTAVVVYVLYRKRGPRLGFDD